MSPLIFGDLKKNQFLHIVMEYAENGDLYQVIKRLTYNSDILDDFVIEGEGKIFFRKRFVGLCLAVVLGCFAFAFT